MLREKLIMTFDLKPFVGAGPVAFGMSPAEVDSLLGPPSRVLKNREGDRQEYREGLILTYAQADDGLADITLTPPASALYEGRDLLALENPISFLRAFDSTPLKAVGITVFFQLGISLTGFDLPADPQKGVGLFAKGSWDSLRHRLRPLGSQPTKP